MIAHLAETALLLLCAYVIGCLAGLGLRRLSRWRPRPDARVQDRTIPPTPQPPPPAKVSATPAPIASPARPRPRSAAIRLAMSSVPDDPPVAPTGEQPAGPPPAIPRAPIDPKPRALAAPRPSGKDDLKRIKGIGVKIELLLNGWGLYHFEQLAQLTEANGAWIDTQLGFKGRVAREHWVAQARAMLPPE